MDKLGRILDFWPNCLTVVLEVDLALHNRVLVVVRIRKLSMHFAMD
jgi:hypothetical protein